MKFILFCQNPYAFGILEPIMQVLKERQYQYLWFLTENLKEEFPFTSEPHTFDLEELVQFSSDAILCPGNEVPHYLRGVKTQIFHGLAGEKKGHFRIRHYFDLYLTQGPYFTRKFRRLRRRYQNFEVVETGWPKLDVFADHRGIYDQEKTTLLQKYQMDKLLLYAPTFSPSLTSAPFLFKEIEELAKGREYLILIKFHDLMDPQVKKQYQQLALKYEHLQVVEQANIIKFLLMADLLISDTSSVVYEFLLLDKPVISFRSNATHVRWDNIKDAKKLVEHVRENLSEDPYVHERQQIIQDYHPYQDGKSAERMVDALEQYIKTHGVPQRRRLPILRRRKMNRMFSRKKKKGS